MLPTRSLSDADTVVWHQLLLSKKMLCVIKQDPSCPGHITTSHSSHMYLSEPIDICHHCQLIQTVVVYLTIQASVPVGVSVTAVAIGTEKH